jgi:hypothetical protein
VILLKKFLFTFGNNKNIQALLQYRNKAILNPGENKNMSRKKLASRILQIAERRASGLQNIDPQLDLGGALTLPVYENAITAFATKIKQYNSLLSAIDALRSEIKVDENNLSDLSAQMLKGVSCKFGADSFEYRHAGGVRRSERKRPARRVVEEV